MSVDDKGLEIKSFNLISRRNECRLLWSTVFRLSHSLLNLSPGPFPPSVSCNLGQGRGASIRYDLASVVSEDYFHNLFQYPDLKILRKSTFPVQGL